MATKHKHLYILWTGSEFRPLFALAHASFIRFIPLVFSLSLSLFLYVCVSRCPFYTPSTVSNGLNLMYMFCCMFKKGRRCVQCSLNFVIRLLHVYYGSAKKIVEALERIAHVFNMHRPPFSLPAIFYGFDSHWLSNSITSNQT